MTTDPHAEDDDVTQAIAALTAAARRTHPAPDTEQSEGFGEIACRVITSVAANLGSADALLAGRFGSSETDLVRQIVRSTASRDELPAYRTEPVRLPVDAEGVLDELGFAQLYREARGAIDEENAQGPSDDDAARLDAECAAVEALWTADLAAYAAAYAETASVAARELGITTGVDVTPGGTDHEWDDLAVRLYEEARLRTPLPSSGIAPKDYANLDLAAAERAAGRTYRERAAKGRPD
jgi:hypothetical protein